MDFEKYLGITDYELSMYQKIHGEPFNGFMITIDFDLYILDKILIIGDELEKIGMSPMFNAAYPFRLMIFVGMNWGYRTNAEGTEMYIIDQNHHTRITAYLQKGKIFVHPVFEIVMSSAYDTRDTSKWAVSLSVYYKEELIFDEMSICLGVSGSSDIIPAYNAMRDKYLAEHPHMMNVDTYDW